MQCQPISLAPSVVHVLRRVNRNRPRHPSPQRQTSNKTQKKNILKFNRDMLLFPHPHPHPQPKEKKNTLPGTEGRQQLTGHHASPRTPNRTPEEINGWVRAVRNSTREYSVNIIAATMGEFCLVRLSCAVFAVRNETAAPLLPFFYCSTLGATTSTIDQ